MKKIYQKILTIQALILLLPSLCFSAPSQPSVPNGTLSDGNSVSITGTGFGNKSPATPIIYDDFDSHTTGVSINGLSPVVGSSWGVSHGGAEQITISTTQNPTNSTKVARVIWNEDSNNTQAAMTFPLTRNGQKFYLYYKRYFDNTNDEPITDINFKTHYASVSVNNSGAGAGLLIIPGGGNTWAWYNNDSGGTVYSSKSWSDTINTWQIWEEYSQLNTPNVANGIIKLWSNGSSILSKSNYNQIKIAQTYTLMRLGMMHQFNASGGSGSNSAICYYDYVYCDDTESRIMIGDNATFENCTIREIQIPTAWSATSISFTTNQGALPNTGNFLFVIDANGDPNAQGKPINFGVGSPDAQSPSLFSITPDRGATGLAVD